MSVKINRREGESEVEFYIRCTLIHQQEMELKSWQHKVGNPTRQPGRWASSFIKTLVDDAVYQALDDGLSIEEVEVIRQQTTERAVKEYEAWTPLEDHNPEVMVKLLTQVINALGGEVE